MIEHAAVTARQGARLVVLPEYFGIFGAKATDKIAAREIDGVGVQQSFLARVARECRIWLVGGTLPIAIADAARVRAASLVFAPDGRRIARYDKMHMFAFNQGDEHYDEGKTLEPGTQAVAFDAPCGRVGLSVCYDLRFPELYRRLGDLALIVVPSAFTAITDRQGHYKIEGLPAGIYSIVVSAPGFSDARNDEVKIEDAAVANRFLSDVIELMVRRGERHRLLLSNKAITAYMRFKRQRAEQAA